MALDAELEFMDILLELERLEKEQSQALHRSHEHDANNNSWLAGSSLDT
jgi:hypothetical protein